MVNPSEPLKFTGISEREAVARLKQEGYNELPSTQHRSIIVIVWENFQEPIFLLLLACGVIYLLLGDVQEAWILLGFVFFITGINLYQEQKTERSLEALHDLSSPRALVIRDGERKRIAGREVVRGDLLVLSEGDRVPADASLLWSTHLTVDESLLTGESLPVRKKAVEAEEQFKMERPGGDDLPCVYSGTLVVQGQGIAEVQATGIDTEMGKIGKALQTVQPEDTILQTETRRIVSQLTLVAIAICVAVIVIYGLTRGNWLQGFLAGIALAMAILPNEIPVVLAIFLALGAWRFSQQRVLTRRIPVVETLGSATVLCVDKTGTLTFNRMSVSQMFVYQKAEVEEQDKKLAPYFYDLQLHERETIPEAFHGLIEFGILASRKDPFDPMEKALKQIGDDYLARTEHLHNDWEMLREYPLSGQLLAMSCVWRSPYGKLTIAAKGAPEAIADLCHFNTEQLQELEQQVSRMAVRGLRVLGIAKAIGQHSPLQQQHNLPEVQHDFEFKFLGLVGLADPVRPTVPNAIADCYNAGIRVVMITGDYPATAQNIARQIGLTPATEVITGKELEQMDEVQLLSRIKTANIFARVVPEQKLLIVNALKRNGEIVAMTGDGVNDAPALKSAHIGIAMGERGTDVARESADLVLLDDDFSSIVQSVRLGRRIFDNLKKGMAYTLAVHVPIAGMSLIPVMFQWPLVLLPVHIAFLHLIIDPACTIVFEAEPEESNVMTRPPRNPKEPLFSHRTLRLALLQGVSSLVVLVLVFAIAYYRGNGEFDARALAFTTLIISNLSMILTNRSWSRTILEMLSAPNAALWWILGGGVVFLGLILYVPLLRVLFRFSFLHPEDLAITLVAGISTILWFEGLKLWNRRKQARK